MTWSKHCAAQGWSGQRGCRMNEHPIPDPASLATGDLAPAIVDLLAHNCRATHAGAVATLVDLTVRGHLDLVAEPTGQLLCRQSNRTPSESLAPFERLLLLYVVSILAGHSAPAEALLPDTEDTEGKRWYATFESAATDEARRQ